MSLYMKFQKAILPKDMTVVESILADKTLILTDIQRGAILYSVIRAGDLDLLQRLLKEKQFEDTAIKTAYYLYDLAEGWHFQEIVDELMLNPKIKGNIDIELANLPTSPPPSILGSLEQMVKTIVDGRADLKKAEKRLPLAQIDQEKTDEKHLIDLRYSEEQLTEFYDAFFEACLRHNLFLTRAEIDRMFYGMIKEIYLMKLKIYDSHKLTDPRQRISHVQHLPHENQTLVMWTQAQQQAIEEFKRNLDNVFMPLLVNLERKKINLYKADGSIRAEATEAVMDVDHPPSGIIDELTDHIGDILFWHFEDKTHQNYLIDSGLNILLWNTLSVQYVLNSNGKDVDVYLPDGEISSVSIFWNYELNTLRKAELAAGTRQGNINYHKLTAQALAETEKITKELKDIQAQITQVDNDINIVLSIPSVTALNDFNQLQAKKTDLETLRSKLEVREYEINVEGKNWEKVAFENLTFKGLNVHNRKFTVGDLVKVGDRLKQQIQRHKERKALKEKTKDKPVSKQGIQTAYKQRVSARPTSASKKATPSTKPPRSSKPL